MSKLKKIRGFTLVELLFVIFIMGVLMSLIVISWHSYGPLSTLEKSVQEVLMMLNLCRSKAIMTGNNWFITIDTVNHRYSIINDDGWLGTSLETDSWGDPWPMRSYFIGSQDFSDSSRNDGFEDNYELARGPLFLGSGKTFLDYTNITQVTFTSDGISFNDNGVDVAEIWISAPEYLPYYHGNPLDGSEDQRKYRKGIKIYNSTGLIKLSR